METVIVLCMFCQ